MKPYKILLLFFIVSLKLFAAKNTHEELTLYLQTDETVYTQTLIGRGDGNTFSDSGLKLSITKQLNADGLGTVNAELLNRTGTALEGVRLFLFSDDAIDETANGFANEYGYAREAETNTTGFMLPAYWQIDEPDYLGGSVVSNLKKGVLDQTGHIDAAHPDDTAMALGFEIGTLKPMHLVEVQIRYAAEGGRLVQVDADTNASLHFDVLVQTPRIAGQPPEANDDNITSDERGTTAIDILSNDNDPDDDLDPASVHLVVPEAADRDGDGDADFLSVAGEGNWSVSEDGNLTFVPAAELTGDPSPVTYRVSDAYGFVSNTATVWLHYPAVQEDSGNACSFPTGLNVFNARGTLRLGLGQTQLYQHGSTLLGVAAEGINRSSLLFDYCEGRPCLPGGGFARPMALPPFQGGTERRGFCRIADPGDGADTEHNDITVETEGRFEAVFDNVELSEIHALQIGRRSDVRLNYRADTPYRIGTLSLSPGDSHTLTFEPGSYFIEHFTLFGASNIAVDGVGDGSGTVRLYVKNAVALQGVDSRINIDEDAASPYDQHAERLLLISYTRDITLWPRREVAALLYAPQGRVTLGGAPLHLSGAVAAEDIVVGGGVRFWQAGIEGECLDE